jgi:hypothetical protein
VETQTTRLAAAVDAICRERAADLRQAEKAIRDRYEARAERAADDASAEAAERAYWETWGELESSCRADIRAAVRRTYAARGGTWQALLLPSDGQ